jgi:hypothetical protein
MQFTFCGPFLEHDSHVNQEISVIYKHSVRTSQHTFYTFITKMNQLMLLRETITVYFQNHMKYTNTLCGQNVSFRMLKHVVHIVVLGTKGLILELCPNAVKILLNFFPLLHNHTAVQFP